MAKTLSLSGIKKLEGKLNNLTNAIKEDVIDEINSSALKIESEAKRLAPVNFGQLRKSIALTKDGDLTYSVAANASYAAYVEFGTGGKVSIPAGYKTFAGKFKGKSGGTFQDFITSLTMWVKAKGLAGTYSVKTQKRLGNKSSNQSEDEKLARFLALKILKNGISPQPFLIPAFENEKPKLIKRLKTLLNA